MLYTATFNGEEMTIQYTAQGYDSYRDDMVELEDVRVDCMEILGVDVDFASLPDTLQSVILELSNEVEFTPET